MAEPASEAKPQAAEPEVLRPDDVADLVAPLPEVNESAIRAEEQASGATAAQPAPAAVAPASAAAKPAAQAQPSRPALVDMQGRTFDPLIHETTDDGKPVLNTYGARMGKLKCRRTPLREYKTTSKVGVDPIADAAAAQSAPQQPAQAAGPQLTPEQTAVQRKAAAATLTMCQLALMRMALGPKLGDRDEERAALVESWEAVLAYYGMAAVHPVMALGIVTGGVVAGAWNQPETRSRLARIGDWFKLRFYGLWLRITGRKRPAETKPGAAPASSAPPAPRVVDQVPAAAAA